MISSVLVCVSTNKSIPQILTTHRHTSMVAYWGHSQKIVMCFMFSNTKTWWLVDLLWATKLGNYIHTPTHMHGGLTGPFTRHKSVLGFWWLVILEEVVAQLVECLPINLLACVSMGSKPVTATLCPWAIYSKRLPWAGEFHQYICDICMWVPPIVQ